MKHFDCSPFIEVMKEFIYDELISHKYGEEVPLTEEEMEEWKPKYFEGSGTWGVDVEVGAPVSWYWDGKWMLPTGTTKKRIYPLGVLRPGVRNELYYRVLGQKGQIPVEFHRQFNHLVNWWKNWMDHNSCSSCGRFTPPSQERGNCVGCDQEY